MLQCYHVIVYLLVGHGAVCIQISNAFTSCDTASLPVNLFGGYTEGLLVPSVYLANIVVVVKG